MTNTDRDLSKLTLKELSDELDALRHTPDICALEQELMRREEALPGGPDIRIRHHEHRGPHTTVVAFEVTGATNSFAIRLRITSSKRRQMWLRAMFRWNCRHRRSSIERKTANTARLTAKSSHTPTSKPASTEMLVTLAIKAIVVDPARRTIEEVMLPATPGNPDTGRPRLSRLTRAQDHAARARPAYRGQ